MQKNRVKLEFPWLESKKWTRVEQIRILTLAVRVDPLEDIEGRLLSSPSLSVCLMTRRRSLWTDGSFSKVVINTYWVTMVVSDYIMFTVFLKFHNVDQLLYNFCPICSGPIRIGQTVEQTN